MRFLKEFKKETLDKLVSEWYNMGIHTMIIL